MIIRKCTTKCPKTFKIKPRAVLSIPLWGVCHQPMGRLPSTYGAFAINLWGVCHSPIGRLPSTYGAPVNPCRKNISSLLTARDWQGCSHWHRTFGMGAKVVLLFEKSQTFWRKKLFQGCFVWHFDDYGGKRDKYTYLCQQVHVLMTN